MSVIKSKRSEADCLFVYNALELRSYTRSQCLKLPKRRTFYGNTEIYELAQSMANHAVRANSIYPLNLHEVQMRRDELILAKADLMALTTEVNDLYKENLINEKVAKAWCIMIDQEERLLGGALKKDRERYKDMKG